MKLNQQQEQDPSLVFEAKERAEQIRQCLDTLPGRERFVIVRRFGLDGDDVNTLVELGRIYGVTRSRILQMQVRGLQRLRCRTLRLLWDSCSDRESGQWSPLIPKTKYASHIVPGHTSGNATGLNSSDRPHQQCHPKIR